MSNINNIKVLHLVTALSWRGGEQQVAYLLDELKNKLDAAVLCSEGSMMEAHCKEQGYTHFTQKKKGGFDIQYAKKVKQVCISQQIDLIHIHDAHAHTFAIIAASLWGNKVPLILSRRVDFPIKKSFLSAFKYNHSSIKKIICVSKTIQQITSEGIRDESKLLTIYSGIDLDKFKPSNGKLRKELKLSDSTSLVGNTSALADHKDYFTFLDVVSVCVKKRADVHFVIMGDGPLKKEIKTYAQQKNVQDYCTFTGFRSDVPTVLSDLDVFLISSKTEGLGTSILDAFACRVPVVATGGGGIPELVEDGVTGLLCEVKNVKQISKALMLLLNDKELQNKLTEQAYRKVQQFSKSQTAMLTFEQYQSVVA